MAKISTGINKLTQLGKDMDDGIKNAISKEGGGKNHFNIKNALNATLDEEGGPMVPIDPHAGESSSEFDGMTREEARKTINWAAKHYNQTEKARKKAFYAKYGTLKGEEEDMEEATGASSSGSYSGPLFGKMGNDSKKTKKVKKIPNSYSDYDIKEEEEEVDEQTGASSSGAYSQPAIWAKNKKNWRAVSDKKFPKLGGPGGTYVKVKDKCKTFPYCNQGDINALEFYEGNELMESIGRVSRIRGKSKAYIAKVIMEAMDDSNLGKKLKDKADSRAKESAKKNKRTRITKQELEEIITRSFYKSPVTDPKAGIVGVAKMDLPIGKIFSMSGNKPKYE